MYAESNFLQNADNAHSENAHRSRQPFHCANCEIDFFWHPTVVEEKTYCCAGCAAGGPCSCDYSQYRSVTISGVIYYEAYLDEGSNKHREED
ncbi:MAG: hypothetical protein M3Z24_08305, partial [Chloroflexota bacterium]|nr:hypothetical protein [Chloroflexota bacterium]